LIYLVNTLIKNQGRSDGGISVYIHPKRPPFCSRVGH